MKKQILYSIIFCWLAVPAKAQVEFAPIGAEWVFNDAVSLDENPLAEVDIYKCTGDSIIGNQVFRKIGDLLFLQEGHKVYLWYDNALELVFDFGLEIGDTVELSMPICLFPDNPDEDEILYQKFRVDTITTIVVDGQLLKKFAFLEWYESYFSSEVTYEYMEKIGNFEYFVGKCYIVATAWHPWLRCYKDSTIEYKSEKFLQYNLSDCYYIPPPSSSNQPASVANIRVAPNPVTDVLTIDMADQKIVNLTITDISGKIMHEERAEISGALQIATNNWPKGMYLCRAWSESRWLVWKVVK